MTSAPTSRVPETDAERRTRHFDVLREMTELAMAIARQAAAKAIATAPDPDGLDPGLTFARATSAARQAVALEARIAAGNIPARQFRPARDPAAPRDPRRPLIRQALHQAAQADPDRTARAALRREIDERLEDELAADPEGEIPIHDLLAKLSDTLGLPLDPSRLPDALLGLAHAPSRELDSASSRAPGHASSRAPDPSWPDRFHQRE